jgi:nucleotide-binding universal stress UspA family protein
MKILVCTDGSKYSQKAIREASVIAEGCQANEVAIIHVHDYNSAKMYPYANLGMNPEYMERLQKISAEDKAECRKKLSESKKIFKDKNIKARTMLKEGPVSDTIVKVAQKEGFDMIVVGSRGMGGLKKMFLGSVSNAIIQEAKNCSVLVVK